MVIPWMLIVFGAVINVGLIEWVKKFPAVRTLKPYYNWLPLIGAVIAGFLVSTYGAGAVVLSAWGVNTLGILSVSTLAYQNIVEFVKAKMQSVTNSPSTPTK